ncbi:MAG TPA: hypothetical protein VGG01_09445 [Xanthobacteraceae bacterium]
MSLVSAMLGAQAGNTQVAVAAKFMRENADSSAAIAQLVEAGAQNAKALANVATGIGANLDIQA